jgi:hypothetical protein
VYSNYGDNVEKYVVMQFNRTLRENPTSYCLLKSMLNITKMLPLTLFARESVIRIPAGIWMFHERSNFR